MLNELNEKLQSVARDVFTKLRDKVFDATCREVPRHIQNWATSKATAVTDRAVPVLTTLESAVLNDLRLSVKSQVDESVAVATRHRINSHIRIDLSAKLQMLLYDKIQGSIYSLVLPLSAVVERGQYEASDLLSDMGNSTDHVVSSMWHVPTVFSVGSLLPSALSYAVIALIRSNVQDLVSSRVAPLIDVNSGAQHAKAKELS